jgi:hypothetical protein
VKLLLDTRADANRVTKYGWTPRSVALNRNCDLTTTTIPLVSQGFHCDDRNKFGNSDYGEPYAELSGTGDTIRCGVDF